MSTTMLSAVSRSLRNSQSMTNVAPCSFCAGPNTSPRKLWAIITWSRTPTLYIRRFLLRAWSGLRIADAHAQRTIGMPGDTRQSLGQIRKRDVGGDQAIQDRVAQELQRLGQPPRM